MATRQVQVPILHDPSTPRDVEGFRWGSVLRGGEDLVQLLFGLGDLGRGCRVHLGQGVLDDGLHDLDDGLDGGDGELDGPHNHTEDGLHQGDEGVDGGHSCLLRRYCG